MSDLFQVNDILEGCRIPYRERVEADLLAFSRSLDPNADPAGNEARAVEHARILVERAKAAVQAEIQALQAAQRDQNLDPTIVPATASAEPFTEEIK